MHIHVKDEVSMTTYECGPRCQPVGLGALSGQSMLVLMVTSRFYVFSTSHC